MWGQRFVRGESTDSHVKGEAYEMRAPPPTSAGGGRAAPIPRGRRMAEDDDYFDDDDDEKVGGASTIEDDPLDAYMAQLEGRAKEKPAPVAKRFRPAPPADTAVRSHPAVADEVDPLDAFMAGLSEAGEQSKPQGRAVEQCDEASDPALAYMELREQQKAKARGGASNVEDGDESGHDGEASESEYRSDEMGSADRVGGPKKQLKDQKGRMELLAEVDHAAIEYMPFNKDFYKPHPTIRMMSEEELAEYRRQRCRRSSHEPCSGLGIKRSVGRGVGGRERGQGCEVDYKRHAAASTRFCERSELAVSAGGFDVSRPIRLFEHAGFEPQLLRSIRKQGFESPTPIQCVTIPVALSGRDVIGIAATGSGKTAAYLLPMITHIMDQPELRKGDGPIGLVLVPTHELAEQVTVAARKLSKVYSLRCTGVFGGVGKYEQYKEIKAGAEIIVGTPGRMMELLKDKKGGLNLQRTTYVVLDEADRMFSLGFEPQVRSILGQVRPDRQTLLFSATFKPALEKLARDVLTEPVRLSIGGVGDANEDVTQVVEVLANDSHKWTWLTQRMAHFAAQGNILVFVSTKAAAEELAANLTRHTPHQAESIHGDRTQSERQEIIHNFKRGRTSVLVATDVASRGLDIPLIKTVVNFDVAKRIEDHTHRIGRTGRAGATDGTAYSLVTQKDPDSAVDLVRSLITAKQAPSPDLLALARTSRRWNASGLQAKLQGSERSAAKPETAEPPTPALSEFAPPSLHAAAKGGAGGGGLINQCAIDAVAMAQAVAARLSAGASASSHDQFAPPAAPASNAFAPPSSTRAAHIPPPPPPHAPIQPPPPPPPPAATNADPAVAAKAAAAAVAARLSAQVQTSRGHSRWS